MKEALDNLIEVVKSQMVDLMAEETLYRMDNVETLINRYKVLQWLVGQKQKFDKQ